jgi:hypothetical protein
MSQSWRDSGVLAISRLKHVLLQQIFGSSVSHASYLNTRKEMIKSRINMIIQIVFFVDFFMFGDLRVNILCSFLKGAGV